MKIISLFNLKGGVGKTTTTINLAYNLSVMGLKVLVIDMDPQVNTTPVFTDLSDKNKTVLDVLEGRCGMRRAIYRSRYKNIDILKGDIRLTESYDTHQLANAILNTDIDCDVVILDCRPSFESLTRNAVYVSDVILTPVILDRFCLDNLELVQQLLANAETFSSAIDWHIFANRVHNVKSQMAIYQEIMNSGDYPFLNTCISERAAVPNALAYRKPVVLHQAGSPAAFDFLQLANEVRGIMHG